MANIQNDEISNSVDWWTLDTTDTSTGIVVGQASPGTVGSFGVYVKGTGWTGELVPRTRPLGGATASLDWVNVAYQNAASGADVAAGTAISTDGKYFVRVDHNEELNLAYTHSAGSVDVVITRGKG